MTYVLESFVNHVGEPIERQYGLRDKGCWGLLKGSDQIAEQAARRLCAVHGGESARLCSSIGRPIASSPPTTGIETGTAAPAPRRATDKRPHRRGRRLVLDESRFKSRIVFRLPYQRFGDHLIARHLLKTHLDVSSAATIKRSFTGKSRLARIFRVSNRYHREYAEPGWAQALITEFPERVGKRLPPKQRELFFVLPRRAQNLSAYFDPFIEGMFWRDPAAFTEGTRAVINQYLNAGSRGVGANG